MLQVQAVLLLLGGCEMPSGIAGMALPFPQDDRVLMFWLNCILLLLLALFAISKSVLDDILQCTSMPAKRIASLIRFREKRKERCFDKKIRYNVRKEVALRYPLGFAALSLYFSYIQLYLFVKNI